MNRSLRQTNHRTSDTSLDAPASCLRALPVGGRRADTVTQRSAAAPVGRDFTQVKATHAGKSDGPAAGFANVHQIARTGFNGPGGPIPHKNAMEAMFNRRFDDVRSYCGLQSKSACTALGALAYAQGSRVAFSTPTPPKGLVAHELAHVVQQSRGVSVPGGVGQPGDRYEREAERAESAANNGASMPRSLVGEADTTVSDAAVLEKRVAGGIRLGDIVQHHVGEAVQMNGPEDAPGVEATPPPTSAFSYAAGLETFQGNIRVWDSDLVFDDDWGQANYLIRLGKVTWMDRGFERGLWVIDQADADTLSASSGFKIGPKLEVRNRIIGGNLQIFLEASLQIAGPDVTETFTLSGKAERTTSQSISLGVEAAGASAGAEAGSGTTIGGSFSAGRKVDLSGAELTMRRGLQISTFSYTHSALLMRDRSIDLGPPSTLEISGAGDILSDADVRHELSGKLWNVQQFGGT
ncbi:MAG: DUF4157 domain-containing protein [Kiloniellales bacterium]|nr:DUF4157 domain-containing protein [Kiloniellales bacterium]